MREIAKTMFAEIPQHDRRLQLAAQDVRRNAGDDRLPAMRDRDQSRDAIDRGAKVIASIAASAPSGRANAAQKPSPTVLKTWPP
jgi:hypothetical protein